MKGKIINVLVLLCSIAYAVETYDEYPLETGIFKLPTASQWKAISYRVDKTQGVVERVPVDQNKLNWSLLIGVQYISRETFGKNILDFDSALGALNKQYISPQNGRRASWEILEKNKNDAIVEWSSFEFNKDIPAEYELSRIFLTETGFHTVRVVKKNSAMAPEEREDWIKLLREHAAVVSYNDAMTSAGFSMHDQLQNSIAIGKHFRNWKVIRNFSFNNGGTSVCHIPPSQSESAYITECLEVVTNPNCNEGSIYDLFQVEKKCVRDKSHKHVEFQILSRTPKEIVYSYNYPKDHVKLNAVVRTFLTDNGYFSITYKLGLDSVMGQKEITKWCDKLKTIEVTPL